MLVHEDYIARVQDYFKDKRDICQHRVCKNLRTLENERKLVIIRYCSNEIQGEHKVRLEIGFYSAIVLQYVVKKITT